MTIPKEYNNDGVLMIPWGREVEAEVKARFGLDKPRTDSEVRDYVAYLEKAATVLQEHPAPITFERLRDYAEAHPRTSEDGCRVVVNRWWLGTAGGEIGGGELIVGWGATLPFCNAIKRLIEDGTLQVVKPQRMLHVALDPANKPMLPGLVVTVLKGPCPDGEPRD
jgi:hypothetical protein